MTTDLDLKRLEHTINDGWENRAQLSPETKDDIADAVAQALDLLDAGTLRVAEKTGGDWHVHQWLKKAVLLSFRLHGNKTISGGPGGGCWFDKVPSKFETWQQEDFDRAAFRAVPTATVRHSAFVGKDTVLMPCFINVGAHIGGGTMIDTWATVGSCAQIGNNCHISGGVGIGGVLEPLQANPVIIEDGCFIGARSEIAEGVIVGQGTVISMGVFLGASTKIVDRDSGEVFRGHVPPYSVVVPGTLPPTKEGAPALACAVIVKRVDEKTRAKTSVNDLLRA